MKKCFSKIAVVLLFACTSLTVSSQVAQTAPAKTENTPLKEQQIKKANDITEKIASAVKITDDQKAKLQTSMLEALVKFNEAVIQAKKEDDRKVSSLNPILINDITARMKTILTPEQYDMVMSKENSK